jgi:8-hydroxy-5-deazaflavin:NADPH oxidoreductase
MGSGHQIIIGSRRPGGTDIADAARAGEVVVNALPGAVSLEVLRQLGPALDGKVIVDVANAVEVGPDGFAASLCYPGGSLAAEIQRALPGAKVVKTLNTVGPATLMAEPTTLAAPLSAFLSGDDAEAKGVVAGLLGDLGWPPVWIIDLGGVATASWPESFLLLVRPLVAALGPVPFGLAVAR